MPSDTVIANWFEPFETMKGWVAISLLRRSAALFASAISVSGIATTALEPNVGAKETIRILNTLV